MKCDFWQCMYQILPTHVPDNYIVPGRSFAQCDDNETMTPLVGDLNHFFQYAMHMQTDIQSRGSYVHLFCFFAATTCERGGVHVYDEPSSFGKK